MWAVGAAVSGAVWWHCLQGGGVHGRNAACAAVSAVSSYKVAWPGSANQCFLFDMEVSPAGFMSRSFPSGNLFRLCTLSTHCWVLPVPSCDCCVFLFYFILLYLGGERGLKAATAHPAVFVYQTSQLSPVLSVEYNSPAAVSCTSPNSWPRSSAAAAVAQGCELSLVPMAEDPWKEEEDRLFTSFSARAVLRLLWEGGTRQEGNQKEIRGISCSWWGAHLDALEFCSSNYVCTPAAFSPVSVCQTCLDLFQPYLKKCSDSGARCEPAQRGAPCPCFVGAVGISDRTAEFAGGGECLDDILMAICFCFHVW